MKNTFSLNYIFGNTTKAASKTSKKRRGRQCRIEELESREMLCTWNPIDNIWVNEDEHEASDCIIVQLSEEGAPLSGFDDAQVQALFELGFSIDPSDAGEDLTWSGKVTWDVSGNVTSIDISSITELETKSALDFSAFSELTSITGLDGATALEDLNISGTAITTLNLAGLSNLTSLNVTETQLITLDISGTKITIEGIEGVEALEETLENLTAKNITDEVGGFDFTGLTALKTLDITDSTGASGLDVSGLTNLTSLTLTGTALTHLNISGTGITSITGLPTSLTHLDMSGLALTGANANVNLSTLTNLEYLDASNSGLTSLNLSGCVELIAINVNGNSLTFSNLTLPEGQEVLIAPITAAWDTTDNTKVNLGAYKDDGEDTDTDFSVFLVNPSAGEDTALSEGVHYTVNNGIITFIEGSVSGGVQLVAGDEVYIVMTNSAASNIVFRTVELTVGFNAENTEIIDVAAPTNVSAVQTGNGEVTVTWVQSWNATGYTVEYSTDGGETWIVVSSAAATALATAGPLATSLTVTGLEAGNHSFRVTAKGNGTSTNDMAAATNATCTVAPITTAQGITGGTFQAKAEKAYDTGEITINLNTHKSKAIAEGEILYYVITCTSHPALGSFVVAGNESAFVLDGLRAGQTYRFSIQVYGADGKPYLVNSKGVERPVSVGVKTSKAPKNSTLAAPAKMKAASGLYSVALTGLKPGTYSIDVWQTSGSKADRGYKFTIEVTVGDDGVAIIDGLGRNGNAGIKYQFRVSKVTDSGQLSAVRNVSGSTVKLNKNGDFPAVRGVKTLEATTTAIKLNWQASPVNEVIGYEVGILVNGVFVPLDVEPVVTKEIIKGRETITVTLTGHGLTGKHTLHIRALASVGGVEFSSALAKRSVNVR